MKLNRRPVLKARLTASTVYSPWILGIDQSKPVQIGLIYLAPISSSTPPAEGDLDAMSFHNDNGGINGRKFEPITESVNGDPSQAMETFKRL